ncbi:MAG: ATP-binding cassette domain-containing protein, partial [Duncaniella sp.]|nr:ATP-binding cassette domain-containing protein [Duncaniella sp.]
FKTAAEITDMLGRLGIADKAGVEAGKLSVGQQRGVAIVRALCQPMDFLLIDEPVSHLDARNNSTVAALIEEEAARQGASIIATSVGNNIDIKNFTVLHL